MPTYRRSLPMVRPTVPEPVADEDPSQTLMHEAATLAATLRARGIQLVIKRHPLDAAVNNRDSIVDLTDPMLTRAGVTLYSLLGASAALVTDYSSIWTDYLALSRPIAFLVPDCEQYSTVRGLHPDDVMGHLPGVILRDERDYRAFAIETATGTPTTSVLRERAVARFGLVHPESPADELLDALSRRGVL